LEERKNIRRGPTSAFTVTFVEAAADPAARARS
jgi:hypothetical protein